MRSKPRLQPKILYILYILSIHVKLVPRPPPPSWLRAIRLSEMRKFLPPADDEFLIDH